MDFSDIRLVGIDLDGTLLHDDKTVSDRTRDAIASATEKGIEIVPITGRPLAGLPEYVTTCPDIKYIIYSNGAHILENGKPLYSFALSNAKAKSIIPILRDLGCMCEVFVDGWGYIEQYVDDFYHSVFSEDTPIGQYVYGSRRITPSIDELLDRGGDVDEIFIICKTPDVRDRLAKAIEDINGIQYWCLGDNFIEITNENTNKGEALAVLCNHIGVDIGATMAIGDGENDLSFLHRAGVAVAMGNAPDVVKEKADIITDTNDNDGVAQIIEKL